MHNCGCKGTTKLQLLQRVFQRMLTSERTASLLRICQHSTQVRGKAFYKGEPANEHSTQDPTQHSTLDPTHDPTIVAIWVE